MAKKKAKPAPVKRDDFIRVRMTSEFKRWLDGLAGECQLTTADVVTQALIAFARDKGYKPAPKR